MEGPFAKVAICSKGKLRKVLHKANFSTNYTRKISICKPPEAGKFMKFSGFQSLNAFERFLLLKLVISGASPGLGSSLFVFSCFRDISESMENERSDFGDIQKNILSFGD